MKQINNKDEISITFEGEEIQILRDMCNTNIGVPEALRDNVKRDEDETKKFLRELGRIVNC